MENTLKKKLMIKVNEFAREYVNYLEHGRNYETYEKCLQEIDAIADQFADPPWLLDLCQALGWAGGTWTDAMREVKRLKEFEIFCKTQNKLMEIAGEASSYNQIDLKTRREILNFQKYYIGEQMKELWPDFISDQEPEEQK